MIFMIARHRKCYGQTGVVASRCLHPSKSSTTALRETVQALFERPHMDRDHEGGADRRLFNYIEPFLRCIFLAADLFDFTL